MTAFVSFGLAALVTYVLRSGMTVAAGRLRTSPLVMSAMGLASPAVLAAMVAAALFLDHGALAAAPVVEVLAVGAGVATVVRTGNSAMALVVGFPVYWAGVLLGLG